ncbi:MAG: glutamate--tRNA ligase [Kordiimonas sp.]|nr:glutamate--tRNA ligase [Kordiimonas sp.]|tara:strand:- start:46 stop:1389 length:1344 start_codon:yes stop_codon:yes gene_type:complete
MTVKVRFAPSPTGRLHVGNVRTALVNWLFCRKVKGTFLLRMDDTDLERSTEEFATAIEQDLTWLGLNWDEFARQSDRFDRYDAAANALKEGGRLYPCYETEQELQLKRKIQLSSGKPPVYDRAALSLTADEIAAFESDGRKPHWRFKLDTPARIEWDDLVRGPQSFDLASLSDPILIREDGSYLYTLPSVVDDIDFGITHIMRGEDHAANSAVQVQLFEALGGKSPELAHFSLLTGAKGEGLSKRLGSASIESFREEEGLEAMAITSLLARIGTSDPVEPFGDLAPLVDGFDFSKYGKAPAKFDVEELKLINAKILHEKSYGDVAKRLEAMGLDVDEDFWLTVRPNISKLADVAEWWQLVQGPVTPMIEDSEFIANALEALPAGELTADSWQEWTGAVKAATGAKGRALFMPLRQALTGMNHGPELAPLLPLMGRERVVARLRGEKA